MTDGEAEYIARSIGEIISSSERWKQSYRFDKQTGDFVRTEGASPVVPDLIGDFTP